MDWKVVCLRFLHSLTLFLYASVTWMFAEFYGLKDLFARCRNGGLNSTDAPFLYVNKPIQNLDHIAFVIYEDDVSVYTICQLILICVNLQIANISFTTKSSISIFPFHKKVLNSSISELARSYLEKQDGVHCLDNKCASDIRSFKGI